MKRITSSILLSAMACGTLSAQSIVENLSSSSAVVVRDPARQSSTEVDAAIYNPAGTAFVKDGLSFSVNGIANFGQTKAYDGTKSYKVDENYVMPSVQLTFKKGKWAFSGSFASEGGYRRSYKDGSPLIDAIAEDVCEALTSSLREEGDNGNAFFSQYSTKSHLNNWTTRLGAAYKISPNLSAYAGLKLNRVSWKAKPNVLFRLNSDLYTLQLSDFNESKTHKESGWGITPIVGLDYNGKAFNIGMKYEFGSHINIGDGEDFTLPAILSLGGNWQALRWLNVAVGGDLYFKSAGNPIFAFDDELYWDASVSATFTCNKSLKANIGWQIGKQYGWTEDFAYRDDLSIRDYPLPSKFSAGIRYAFTDKISMDLGVAIITSQAFKSSFNNNLNVTFPEDNGVFSDFSGSSSTIVAYKKRTPIQVAVGFNYGL